jgi:hypothetical protein
MTTMPKTSIGGRHIAKERGLFPAWSGWPFRREAPNAILVRRNPRMPRATKNRCADERIEPMPGVITAENLATRVAHALGVVPRNEVESLTEMLRVALVETRSAAIAATKTVCLEIAEDEAEQCRGVGATTAQQTALTIAARIRKRHVPRYVEVR